MYIPEKDKTHVKMLCFHFYHFITFLQSATAIINNNIVKNSCYLNASITVHLLYT